MASLPSSLDALQLNAQQDQQLTIQSGCNETLQGFGRRLWDYLCDRTPKLSALLDEEDNNITAIHHSDRYLRSPLVLALLLEFLHTLVKLPAGKDRLPVITLQTNSLSRSYETTITKNGTSQFLHHDWNDEKIRNQVLTRVFEYAGLNTNLVIGRCQHAQELKLDFTNDKEI